MYLPRKISQAVRKYSFDRTAEASETPIETIKAVFIHQKNAIYTGPAGDLLFPIQFKSRH